MVRVRIKYEKVGTIRFTSHKDVMRAFRRSFAAAEIPVCYSQGFNPHPRLSFGPSLRTGWEGLDEYLDAQLESPVPDVPARCNPMLPDGLRILDCALVSDGVPKIAADVAAARYGVTVAVSEFAGTTCPGWIELAQDAGMPDVRGGRFPTGALAGAISRRRAEEPDGPQLLDLEIYEDGDEIRIDYLSTMEGSKSLYPSDLLEPFIGDPAAGERPAHVVRKALFVRRDVEYFSPISKGVVQKQL